MHLYCFDANSCAFSSLLEIRFPVLGGSADSKILRRDCFRRGVIFAVSLFYFCVSPTSAKSNKRPTNAACSGASEKWCQDLLQ